jgi:hypothetical protein
MIHARADYDRIQDPEHRIPDNEPVFLIRGQDRFGADAVAAYANMLEREDPGNPLIHMAREHVSRMRAWKVHKTPDVPDLFAAE